MEEEKKTSYNMGNVLPVIVFIVIILAPLLFGEYLLSQKLQKVEYDVETQPLQSRGIACPTLTVSPTVTPTVTISPKGVLQQSSPSGSIK